MSATREHAGVRIAAGYKPMFAGYARALESRRSYDMGALQLARDFAAAFDAPLFYSTTSRLLADTSRSPGHLELYLEIMRRAPADLRARILRRRHDPCRTDVENCAAAAVAAGYRVLHVSFHSYAPARTTTRRADVALLFDSGRAAEARVCTAWQAELQRVQPDLTVRRNHPHRGIADGLVAYLRRTFDERYIGIEIEVNQHHAAATASRWKALRGVLLATFASAVRTAL